MDPIDLIQPETFFLVWYLIPGYLSLFLFITMIRFFTPTITFRWNKISNLDKLILSITFSTIIFYSYTISQRKTLEQIFNVGSGEIIGLISLSLALSLIMAIFIFLLIYLANEIIIPYYFLFVHFPVRRWIFRKNLSITFCQDFFTQKPNWGLGPVYSFLYVMIESAYQNKNTVEIKTKTGKEPIKGMITQTKQDYSEIGIVNNKKLYYIKTDDIQSFAILDRSKTNIARLRLKEMKLAGFYGGLLLITMGFRIKSWFFVIISLIFSICIWLFVLRRWSKAFNDNRISLD